MTQIRGFIQFEGKKKEVSGFLECYAADLWSGELPQYAVMPTDKNDTRYGHPRYFKILKSAQKAVDSKHVLCEITYKISK